MNVAVWNSARCCTGEATDPFPEHVLLIRIVDAARGCGGMHVLGCGTGGLEDSGARLAGTCAGRGAPQVHICA